MLSKSLPDLGLVSGSKTGRVDRAQLLVDCLGGSRRVDVKAADHLASDGRYMRWQRSLIKSAEVKCPMSDSLKRGSS